MESDRKAFMKENEETAKKQAPLEVIDEVSESDATKYDRKT